jgi:UPF0176 protein
MYSIYTFYEFFYISQTQQFKEKIFNFLHTTKIKGTILIAFEGINGTIAGPNEDIENFAHFILNAIEKEKKISKKENPEEFKKAFKTDFIGKISKYGNIPFLKTKVKVKKEIVSIKLYEKQLSAKNGHYIDPKDWDEAISDKDAIVIDNRNDYEIELGTFKNSIDPKNEVFSQFPKWLDKNLQNVDKSKKIIMFCTGGVRCEKSTRLMIDKGFENVYHLKGGIIEYLKQTKNKNSKWIGKCLVFDDRHIIDENNA